MNVLVTGGTGTFGHAFVRRALEDHAVERIAVLSRDELKQADMGVRFKPLDPHGKLRFLLGDVRDRGRLDLAFHRVDLVVHAAALKRVDAVAYDPAEVIKTNVLGTINVVEAAITQEVPRVVVISSDKSVMATNIYGASKFMAEQYAVQANSYGVPRGVRICAVRYGNVLGSRGSVVHVWRRQLAAGEPLTITDVRCTRFLMTADCAVNLVLDAAQDTHGGEVFIPKLRAANIADLAIALSGRRLGEWVAVGLRPGGEKLHEVLLSPEEASRTFEAPSYYLLLPATHPWASAPPPFAKQRVAPAFVYSSETAPRIGVDELRDHLKGVPDA